MPGKKPAKMYRLIGMEDSGAADHDAFEFRPLGYGAQDVGALLRACEDVGAQWVVVEQDAPSLQHDSMGCARMSIDTLKTLGENDHE